MKVNSIAQRRTELADGRLRDRVEMSSGLYIQLSRIFAGDLIVHEDEYSITFLHKVVLICIS